MLQAMKSLLSMFLCLLLTGFNPQSYKTMMEEREELASPVVDDSVKGMIGGTFIQSWLAVALNEDDWDTELEKMKELGMEYLIFQTLIGDEALYNTDPEIEDDMLSIVLKTAKKHGMKIIIGLTDGSDIYYSSVEAYTNMVTLWAEPFKEFHEKDIAEATKMMNDILGKYSDYDEEIYGWYFAHEFFNNPLYGEAAWKSIGRHINSYIQAIENSTAPEKPLILSPYYLIGVPNIKPDSFVTGLKILFTEAKFRPFDIFMPQDGFGTNTKHLPTDIVVPSLLAPWIEAMSKAAQEFDVTFWINNEAFTSTNIDVRPPEQLAIQVLATDKYAETHFIFSWNHYYSATYYSDKTDLEQRFADIFVPN